MRSLTSLHESRVHGPQNFSVTSAKRLLQQNRPLAEVQEQCIKRTGRGAPQRKLSLRAPAKATKKCVRPFGRMKMRADARPCVLLISRKNHRGTIGEHRTSRLHDISDNGKGRGHLFQTSKHPGWLPNALAMIRMKNNSRCSGKNEGISSLVSYYQPIVVPVRKTLTRVWMVPVARLIVPESGKARQKVGIAIALDPNVHSPS
jgi:hypothetical protein